MSIIEALFGTRTPDPAWPKDSAGNDIAPAFLTHLREADFEGQIVISLLTSSDIPVVTQLPNGGSFGRVILGISGTGTDLFVPATMLDEAKALLNASFEEDADA